MFLFFVLYRFTLTGNYCYGSEIRHGIFWGINFSPGIFLGFDFCPHSIIPGLSLEIRSSQASGLEFT